MYDIMKGPGALPPTLDGLTELCVFPFGLDRDELELRREKFLQIFRNPQRK